MTRVLVLLGASTLQGFLLLALLGRVAPKLRAWERLCGALLLVYAQILIGQLVLGALGLLTRPFSPGMQVALSIIVGAFAGADGIRSALRDVSAALRFLRNALDVPAFMTVTIAGIVLSGWAVMAYLLPSFLWDGLAYHLPIAARMLTFHGFSPQHASYSVMEGYPRNLEIIMAWVVQVTGSAALTDAVQFPLLFAACAAVGGWCHARRLPANLSLTAAALVPFSPLLLFILPSTYIDVAVGALGFLAVLFAVSAYGEKDDGGRSALSGIAMGVAAGMKGVALPWAVIVAVGWWWLARRQVAHRWKSLFAFAAGVAIFGAYWYLRSAWHYGNPFFPVRVALLGIALPGELDLSTPASQAIPPHLQHLPDLAKLVVSWMTTLSTPTFRETDIGGFGWLWSLLFLPSLVWLCVRRMIIHELREIEGARFAVVLLGTMVLATPGMWIARYTLMILPLGALAFAVVLTDLRSTVAKSVLRLFAAGLAVATTFAVLPMMFVHPIDLVKAWRSGPEAFGAAELTALAGYAEAPAWKYLDAHAREGDTIVVPGRMGIDPDVKFTGALYGPRLDRAVLELPPDHWREALEAGRYVIAPRSGEVAKELFGKPERYEIRLETPDVVLAEVR